MAKTLLLAAVLSLASASSANALTWSCTCRDSDGNDLGGVTVNTHKNASWDEAVRKANKQCKLRYSSASDGSNCDSED
jgi:hypothetical protein